MAVAVCSVQGRRSKAFLSDSKNLNRYSYWCIFVVPLTESRDSTFHSIKVIELTKAELPVDSFMAF